MENKYTTAESHDISLKDVLAQMKETTEKSAALAEEVKGAVEKMSKTPRIQATEETPEEKFSLWVAAHLIAQKDPALRETKSFAEAKRMIRDRFGEEAVKKALETSDVGFLPTGVIREIEKQIQNQTVGRSLFRTLRVSEKSGKYPLVGPSAAEWVSEGAAVSSEGEPTFASLSWDVNTVACGLTVTYETFNDFALLESTVKDLMTEAIAEKEDEAFLTGDGTGEPLGIYMALNSATDLTDGTNGGMDVLVTVWHELKPAYRKNAVWFMNETTLANLRKQKTSQDVYYFGTFPTGFQETIFGRPIYTNSNLADNVVLVGDPARYLILDKVADGSGAREMGFLATREGKTLVSTRSIYLMVYDRLGGLPVYKASAPAIKPWRGITAFLQTA